MERLLLVNNYYYRRGGAEIVFLEQARMFAEAGWDVAPFCMTHPQNFDTPWSEYFVDEIEFGRNYSPSGKVIRAAKVIYSLESKKKAARLLREFRPDVIHVHNVYHHISPSVLPTLRKSGRPVVMTLHDLKIACPAYKMLTHDGICERCKTGGLHNVVIHRCVKNSTSLSLVVFAESALHRALRTYSRCIDRFIVPSRFYLEKLVAWGWDRKKFVHVPNHVHAPEYQPGKLVGRTFAYVGRLGHEKGLATLLRAAAISKSRVSLVGTGPEEGRLRGLADELGVEVSFLGYLTGAKLHDAIRAARVLVLPSEWYENAPISVMEAYALGRPVIGARIGGIPELIQEGQTGTTFESGNVDQLASVLADYQDSPDQRLEDMGMNGRAWMERDYSRAMHFERIALVYRSLTGQS